MRIGLVYPHSVIPTPDVRISDALAICMYEMTRRLARRHEVVAYPRRGPGDAAEAVHEGVNFHRIDVRVDELLSSFKVLDRLGLTAPDWPYRFSSLYYRHYARAVALDLNRRRVQLAHLFGNPGFIPIIRRHNPDIRIVLHCHDHALVDFNQTRLSGLVAQADLILACSEFLAEAIRRRFPAVAERCHALHNGIDPRFLQVVSAPALGRQILFVGRLSPEKGVHVLVDSFARIASDIPDANLRLVGPPDLAPKQFVDPFHRDPVFAEVAAFYGHPGRYQEHLVAMARPLAGRVAFAGPCPNSEVTRELAGAALFCFPSIWQEPFGMPLIEAMAAGLPVVATRHGAFPEIVVHGETGLLVERGDPVALAEAITSLLADPERRRRMGEAGRRRATELFTWDGAVDRLMGLYERITEPDSLAA